MNLPIFIRLAFPTGNTYEIPTLLVVRSAANFDRSRIAEEGANFDPEGDGLEEKWARKFGDKPSDCITWLKDNMTMDEVMPHARLIACEPPTEFWSDADATLEPLPGAIEITAETFLRASALAFIQQASNKGQSLDVQSLMNEKGESQAALCVLLGGPAVIDVYMSALAQANEILTNPPAEKSRILLPN